MPEFDLMIRGGTVVDGTGGQPRRADVAISKDRIVAVGTGLNGNAIRTVDASRRIVTPGFFDPHTHLDAQIGWDPSASPVLEHGITSVVIGNCGVTFAPCLPGGADQLATLMEAVEEVPVPTILAGLPWDWESYGEYLESVGRMPKAVNVGGLIGHCAIRSYVMGAEQSLDPKRVPTDTELAQMSELVAEALRGGALGVSTSRTLRHTLADGRAVPGTFAERPELLALCEPLRKERRGIFEVGARLSDKEDYEYWQRQVVREMGLLAAISMEKKCPVTFNLFNHRNRSEPYQAVLDFCAAKNAMGARMRPQVAARRINELHSMGWRSPFKGAAWDRLEQLDMAERLAVLDDDDQRRQLIADTQGGESTPHSSELYYLGHEAANYEYGENDTLQAAATRAQEKPVETFIRIARETRGRAVWARNLLNHLVEGIERMITDPNTLLGLGDTGAHVGRISDSSLTTYVIAHWVRDQNVLSLAEGVRRLTADPAHLYGQLDRGLIRPGAYADINVIDLENLQPLIPEYVRDLPGGAGRWVQGANGYDLTIVNGTVVAQDGKFNGRVPGEILK